MKKANVSTKEEAIKHVTNYLIDLVNNTNVELYDDLLYNHHTKIKPSDIKDKNIRTSAIASLLANEKCWQLYYNNDKLNSEIYASIYNNLAKIIYDTANARDVYTYARLKD